MCIDFGANLIAVKAEFPFIRTIEVDLNTDVASLLPPSDLVGAIIVNADNIEHVSAAEQLLLAFGKWMEHANALLISTPDRIKHGHAQGGPPPNRAHIREWSLCEFVRFSSRFGPPLFAAGWTENHNVAKMHITLFVVAVHAHLRDTVSIAPELYKEWTVKEALACLSDAVNSPS